VEREKMNSIKDQLDAAWTERNNLRSEGYKLYAEGYKLYAEGYNLRSEGYNLCIEGDKLYTDGNNLWADKVAEVCGSEATIEWATTGCRVMDMEFKSTD
jgi:hypothetical protein